ncbi:GerMN domain-containing protein (plasmid) [Bacillus sp. 31A1R]|uniref:GerMN domain-containing protein n=1 Tax=Robertmurraya mangrovi TaxID=3098077 RepID=A0ABU5IUF2_9BACI|nr:GerMN domain-containing protein [Bacillus sp. 31A1R]MDZ5470765.1 GerMN domain-containing protein [Bacillus sp. 31A1R]
MSKNKKIVSAVIVSSVLLSGCGLLGGEKKEKIDPPQSVTYTDDGTSVETTGKEAGENEAVESSLMTELYLVDKNGYVVPQTVALPKTNSVAKQALEHLVQNGPVTEMLPNGFAAVIPSDTSISVDIKDKVAVVDFSKEFKNYKPEDEMKILQSVTWTLTQFDSIDSVRLKLNGHELTEMPVNGTPISDNLTRANGINLDTSDVADVTNTKAVTVYYLGGEEGNYYYVPITRRVSNSTDNNIVAAVNELVKGPSYTSNLVSDFLPDVKLLEEPKVEDGKVTLNFNESVYGSFEEKIISQHLLSTLVLSLTEQTGIESVAVTVNGEADLVNEEGDKLTEPVTRPENVNTGSF